MAVVRFEVWTRPESGTFVRKFPLKGVVDWGLQLGIFGRGTLTLPKDYPRLNDILFIDPLNHANDNASLIRAFVDETWLHDFYATRAEINFGDMNQRVATISGGAIGTALDRVVTFPFDYDLNPSKQPDHVYGGTNQLLGNESFEDAANPFINGTFENGTVEPWTELDGVDTNGLDTDLVTTTDEAHSGTLSLEINPGARHSGAKVTLECTPGAELTIDGWVKSNTVGRRITCAVKVQTGMTFASTNGYTFNGWHIVEIGNVAHTGTGLPGGSTNGAWQALGTIKVTPPTDVTSLVYAVQDDHHNGTNGPIFYIDDFVGTGLGVGLDPWASYLLTTMEVDTVEFTDGVQSAKVGGPNGAALYQDIEGMVVGLTYTATFNVKHAAGVDKNIGAQFTIPGNPGATVLTTTTVPTGVWTEISVTWVATQTTGRVETKNVSGGALDWWVDETSAGEGLAKATYGAIMGDMLDDAGVDHSATRTALTWLVPTYTDLLDSHAVAWDQKVSFTIKRGQPARRIVTFHGDKFGYEADIHPNISDYSIMEFDLFNPETQGQDFTTGDSGAINRSGLESFGPIIRRDPLASYALIEGDQQYWGESLNAVIEGTWGAIETYDGSDEIVVGTLNELAGRLTTGVESETVVATFRNPNLLPGIDYKIGDKIVLMLGEDILPAATYRVVSIDVASGDPEPIFQVQFVSEASYP